MGYGRRPVSDEKKLGRVRGFLSGISVATRIASAVIVVSLLSLTVATVIGLNTGRDLGGELFDDQIEAIRSAGNGDATAYLNSLALTAESLAASPQASGSIEAFSSALEDIGPNDLGNREKVLTSLAEEYQELYLDPLGDAGRTIDVRDVLNEGNADALYLQSNYSVGFEPLSSAGSVDDARDGSEWSDVHRRVHPTYRRIVNSLNLSDALLVDTDTDQIVYTVNKRADLGASTDVGPISGTIVSSLVERVKDDPDGGVQAADFRRYDPALLTPVAGVAAPVLDDGTLVGALIFLFDSTELTRILTNDADFENGQFPEGGDIYLLGTDSTTRSEPRGYLESPTEFLDAAAAKGQLNDADRQLIELSGTTVLALTASDSTATAADDMEVDAESRVSIDGRSVFSSVEQLDYEGFPMYVVAEVDKGDAERSLEEFQNLLIVGVAIFMVILAFVAVAWSISIMRPVRSLSDRLAVGATNREDPIDVPERSPIEFHRLAARFEAMALTLRRQHAQLREVRTERLALMKRMLPSSVADRLAAGDPLSLDEAPDASVAVLAFTGLSAIGHDTHPEITGERRADLEEFLGELDALARQHGLEPIKVIGDEYYAAVGHDRPYIDHAPRAVAFVTDAFDLLAAGRMTHIHDLRLSAGVASGPVAVGLTGANGLVYDVWGVTVKRADQLARRAGSSRLLVAEDTATKLPDSMPVEPAGEVTGQLSFLVSPEMAGER